MTIEEIRKVEPLMATHIHNGTYICRTNNSCYALDCNGEIDRKIEFRDEFKSLGSYDGDIYGYSEGCKEDYADYY